MEFTLFSDASIQTHAQMGYGTMSEPRGAYAFILQNVPSGEMRETCEGAITMQTPSATFQERASNILPNDTTLRLAEDGTFPKDYVGYFGSVEHTECGNHTMRAEFAAVLDGLSRTPSGSTVVVHSDSTVVGRAINKENWDPSMYSDQVDRLHALRTDRIVRFVKVGRVGGNRLAPWQYTMCHSIANYAAKHPLLEDEVGVDQRYTAQSVDADFGLFTKAYARSGKGIPGLNWQPVRGGSAFIVQQYASRDAMECTEMPDAQPMHVRTDELPFLHRARRVFGKEASYEMMDALNLSDSPDALHGSTRRFRDTKSASVMEFRTVLDALRLIPPQSKVLVYSTSPQVDKLSDGWVPQGSQYGDVAEQCRELVATRDIAVAPYRTDQLPWQYTTCERIAHALVHPPKKSFYR